MLIESLQVTGSFQVSGAANIPYGTTASRTAGTGSLFYSINDNNLQIDDGAYWVTLTSSNQPTPPSKADIEYLVVAGGGGGGGESIAGGGGAGGLLSSSLSSIKSGSSITVTVGAGGAGGSSPAPGNGVNGVNSSIASAGGTSFTTVTSTGGGGGAGGGQAGTAAGSGGSGGGGAYTNATAGGSGTVGQGFDGGDGAGTQPGGGGGASEEGNTDGGGHGGDGKQSSITGTSTYYAGGGGGSLNSGPAKPGGDGGGGASYGFTPQTNAVAGTSNTGGGGGGGYTGGSGGSGIVILAYPSSSISANGGIKSTRSDGHIVHTFNNSGTFTVGAPDDYIVPNQHFDVVTYTGNGSTQSISSLGFQPDLVWVKTRSLLSGHVLRSVGMDSTYILSSNSTAALNTAQPSGGRLQLDSNGFTVRDISNNGYGVNGSDDTQVAWCWKAGGSAVSNTDGTITSSVSANSDIGFSIVKYTGNNLVGGGSVGHSLGVTPEMIILKNLDDSSEWVVYHKDHTTVDGAFLQLHTTGNVTFKASGFYPWDVSEFSSTTFSLGSNWNSVNSNDDYIAYCFASIDGRSKVGTYTGNGSSQTISGLGFKPRFLLIKGRSWTGNWVIFDNSLVTSGNDNWLYPNLNNIESGGSDPINFTSDGFTLNDDGADYNTTINYLYLAIA